MKSDHREAHPYRFGHFRTLFANDPATHEALEATTHGRILTRSTRSAFLRPALDSVGRVHDVLVSTGKGVCADVARAAAPMALMRFASHVLSAGSPVQVDSPH